MTWDVSLQICLMHINEQINQPIMQMQVHALIMRQKEDILKQGYGLSRISMLPKDYGRLETWISLV